jgi:hypothetical protein
LRAVVVLQKVLVSFDAAHELKERFGANEPGGAASGIVGEAAIGPLLGALDKPGLRGIGVKKHPKNPRKTPKIPIFREKNTLLLPSELPPLPSSL